MNAIKMSKKLFQTNLRSYASYSIFKLNWKVMQLQIQPSRGKRLTDAVPVCNNYCLKSYSSSKTVCQRRLNNLTQTQLYISGAEMVPSEEEVTLSSHIKNANSVEEIFQTLETTESASLKLSILNDTSRTLFNFLKTEKSPSIKLDILNSVGMQKFCKVLRYKAKYMDSQELINAAKVFVMLNATGSHLTFQIILKLLSKKANSLELNQIVYIQFLLSRLGNSKSPLAAALEVALPIVFESQLNSQLNTSDIQGLCDYLHFASKCNVSDQAIEVLVKALLHHNPENINPKQALSVIWSLCDLENNPPYQENLVKLMFQRLTNNMEALKSAEISTTLQKCCSKYSKNCKWFYQEDFVDSVCNRHIGKNNDPVETLYLFKTISLMGAKLMAYKFWLCPHRDRVLSRTRHMNVEFIDRVADIISNNPSLILKDEKRLLFSLVRSFSSTNYKPENWSKIEELILDPDLTTNSIFGDIHLAANILCLGAFPEALIKKLLSSENIPKLEEFVDRNVHSLPLVIIDNAVNLLYTEYDGPRLPKGFFKKLKNRDYRSYLPLKNSLICAFGGDPYVLNQLFYNGILIDHAVVMRKGGYPVAINCENNLLMDLHSINAHAVPDSITVLVKLFFKEAFANNTSRLRGIYDMELKLLKSTGHPVIPIDVNSWTELPEFERIPYLMHRIKEKIEKFQWNRNSSDVIPS